MLLQFYRAVLTYALNLHTELLHPKARRQPAVQLYRIDSLQVDVSDRAAARTNQMMMRMRIAINAPAMTRRYLAQHAGFDERPEVLVHGGKGNRGQLALYPVVDLLRRIVARSRQQGLVDLLPLMGGGQTVLMAQPEELVVGIPAHT